MRQRLCELLIERANDPKFVFLTGDVGFGLLEPLRDALGERFINAGVAEQSMVGVAAGMSAKGLETQCMQGIGQFIVHTNVRL